MVTAVGTPLAAKCIVCGQRNPPGATTCSRCHSQLPTNEPYIPDRPEHPLDPVDKVYVQDLRCNSCGAALPPTPIGDFAVCPYCGVSQLVEAAPPSPASSQATFPPEDMELEEVQDEKEEEQVLKRRNLRRDTLF